MGARFCYPFFYKKKQGEQNVGSGSFQHGREIKRCTQNTDDARSCPGRELCQVEPWIAPPPGKFSPPVMGEVPEKFRRFADLLPDHMPVRQDFLDAADKAEEIYRQQISVMLDGENIEAFCAREPWCDKNLSQYTGATFGYVPERYKEAAHRFASDPEKSEHYRTCWPRHRAFITSR
jgi:hypothetical protein